MNQPHKHKDLIIAWANGEQIEYRNHRFSKEWKVVPFPAWSDNGEYRVKPKEVTRQFQVALLKYERCFYTRIAEDYEQTKMLESYSSFVRWLTEPISYQVEE